MFGLKQILSYLWRGNIKNDSKSNSHTETFFNGSDISTIASSTDSQFKLSAVFRCIDVLSNSISKLPFFITDSVTHKFVNDRYCKQLKMLLNTRPNPNMTASIFNKLMEINRLITGNAYALMQHDNTGMIKALIPLNSQDVTIKTLENGEVFYEVSKNGKNAKTYRQDEIVHIKGISFDGIKGESVLSYARTITTNSLLQEEYTRRFYSRGGRAIDVLSQDVNSKTPLSYLKKNDAGKDDPKGKNDYERLREQWEIINQGDNAGKVAILPYGMTYSAVPQINMRDMAFIEAKEISIADVARFFGVPLYKLFAGKESYQSNEQNGIAYVTDTLAPILTQYEQEYTSKCLLEKHINSGYSVKGNLNAEMRGDLNTRGGWYVKNLQSGVYNINEIRGLEDMPAIEGGEIHYMSLNYAPIDLQKQWWEERIKSATDAHLGQVEQKKDATTK